MVQIARQEISVEQNLFDPKKVLGNKWQVLGGDKRNVGLVTVDLSRVILDSTLRKGESSVRGRERHARLMISGSILLGPDLFYELWRDPYLIPRSWEKPVNGEPSIITFDGGYIFGPPKTLMPFGQSPTRYVIYLILQEEGCSWGWGVRSIDERFFGNHRAATLPWNYRG